MPLSYPCCFLTGGGGLWEWGSPAMPCTCHRLVLSSQGGRGTGWAAGHRDSGGGEVQHSWSPHHGVHIYRSVRNWELFNWGGVALIQDAQNQVSWDDMMRALIKAIYMSILTTGRWPSSIWSSRTWAGWLTTDRRLSALPGTCRTSWSSPCLSHTMQRPVRSSIEGWLAAAASTTRATQLQ